MTTYNVWVGGANSWNRSYSGEVGFYPLTEEQVKRWVGEDIDTDAMAERLHRDWDSEKDGEDDFPSRDEVENGCCGFGAYTDQIFGVAKVVDNEEEIIWSGTLDEMRNVEDEDEDEEPRACFSTRCEPPGWSFENDQITYTTGIGYSYVYKGGWGSTVELPDDEEFDVRKLEFDILEVDGLGEIVTGFRYGDEEYYDDSDSDGKSCDWYLIHEGDFYSI